MRIRNAGDSEGVRTHLDNVYRRRNYGPEKVAHAIVKAVKRSHNRVVLVSPESQIMYRIERLFPRLSRLIARSAANRMFDSQQGD